MAGWLDGWMDGWMGLDLAGMVPLLFFEDEWTKEMREVFMKLDADGNG